MKRRILFVTDTLGIGGTERQLALLVKYLPLEWERRVWSLSNGPFAEVIPSNGVSLDVRERRWRYDIAPLLNLWEKVIRWQPRIVHSWGWVCSATVAPICRFLRIPWIDGSIRIGEAPFKNHWRARMAFALADRVIANSQAGLDAFNIPKDKGRVIYNGFDPERLPFTERDEQPNNPFTVIMVGRMSSSFKDFESFIHAARKVTGNTGKEAWHFRALGYGVKRATLIDSAAELIENGDMDFPEAGLEVLPYLRQAHVGVLMTRPPNTEGCSNAIMEYMACGLPVICSDSGGNRELVVEGETGFIVPPQDVDALASRLLWLRSHPQEASAMGIAGRKRFLEQFTVEKMVACTTNIYNELLTLRQSNRVVIRDLH